MLKIFLTIKTLKMMVLIMMREVQLIRVPWIVEHSAVSQVVSWILIYIHIYIFGELEYFLTILNLWFDNSSIQF